MEIVSLPPLLCSVVALCLAVIHGYTWWLRRHEPAHLWLAVGAVGIVGIAASTAMIYEAAGVAQAELWQRIMLSCAAVVLLGFHSFTRSMLGLAKRRADRIVEAIVFAMVAQGLWPQLVFGGAVVRRTIGGSGMAYAAREIGGLGVVFLAGLVAVALYLTVLWVRNREKLHDHRRILTFGITALFLTGVNDVCVGVQVYEGPLLVVFGYTAFLTSFSAILIQRLVRSMDEVELSAERLHELVDQRTEELRQKDMQLAHGDRMATIGTLAASVAHEINNPIAFVHANLSQLEALWHKPEEADEVHDILMECRDGVDRVRSIVTDLLSMARRSDGRNERVHLGEVIESALPLLRREAKNRARLTTELLEVPAVIGDPHLLGQIVLNLAVNALHAIPKGNPEREEVKISISSEGDSVRLVVKDTGSGIPQEVLPHIYDPFFTTKKDGKGTGLGLAVTHQLVTRHRGKIEIETGKTGTTMTVELPAAGGASDLSEKS